MSIIHKKKRRIKIFVLFCSTYLLLQTSGVYAIEKMD